MKIKALKICAIASAFALLLSSAASAATLPESSLSALFAGSGAPLLAAPAYAAPYLLSLSPSETPEEDTKEELVDRGHFAYVVSAEQKYNKDTDRYYAVLDLINETGGFTVTTVDDVENYNFQPMLKEGFIGKLSSLEGRFIQFDMRKTDKIQKLEPRRSAVSKSFSEADGFYLVNIIAERGGIISFYDTASDMAIGENALNAALDEDGHAIIAIDGDSYCGAQLSKLSRGETELYEGSGNAVIQMIKGKVVRIFSFADGYEI